MQHQITAIRRAAVREVERPAYYDEISAPPYDYAASSRSFIGQLFCLLGMRNITNDRSGFPQLSQEFIIKASPQLIFLSDNQRNDGGVTAHRGRHATRVVHISVPSGTTRSTDSTTTRRPAGDHGSSCLMREISNAVFAYRRAHH